MGNIRCEMISINFFPSGKFITKSFPFFLEGPQLHLSSYTIKFYNRLVAWTETQSLFKVFINCNKFILILLYYK